MIDILVHCGDFLIYSISSPERHTLDFLRWFTSIPARHHVLCFGNHEIHFDNGPDSREAMLSYFQRVAPSVHVLFNASLTLPDRLGGALTLFGSPHTVYRGILKRANAFSVDSDAVKSVWDTIPDGIDVMVTHSPPYGVLDGAYKAFRLGDPNLLRWYNARLASSPHQLPKLHMFGHCHEDYGYARSHSTLFVNAAMTANPHMRIPHVIELYNEL